MSEYCSEVYNYWVTGDPELCTVSPATNDDNYPILWLIIVNVIQMFANLYGYVTLYYSYKYHNKYPFHNYRIYVLQRMECILILEALSIWMVILTALLRFVLSQFWMVIIIVALPHMFPLLIFFCHNNIII